ncbi:alpha/beta fold hydrolase [Guptibacillus sedimenti]|uniref:alpha/beta fold hydrolase n=1 Tax=Guptibacillus sedimenti TaxID=3025680 RepID=UPI00235EF0AC|nr:alpha/beta hydrolase [Pseudalkalibacillus sedimenti]
MKKMKLKIEGLDVCIYEWGSQRNPTVLLLHGLTNNALGFNEIADRLQDHFHLFAIDLPGHGDTQPFNDEKKYSFQFLTEWLEKVRFELSNQPVYLIGHSWGAALALHFSSRFSEMVNGIVMIDGGYLLFEEDLSITLEGFLKQMSQWITESYYSTIEEYEKKKKEEIGRCSHELEQMVHRDMKEVGGGVAMKVSENTVRAIGKSLYLESCRDVFHQVHVPTFLIRATLPEDGETIRRQAAARMQEELGTHCKVSAIPETGHVLHWQRPEETIKKIKQWLEEKGNEKIYTQAPE